jgi:hypothetical protein
MNNPDALEIAITISASDHDTDDLDSLTRQLLSELKNIDLETVKLASHEILSDGAKNTTEAVTVGVILLAVLPTMLPKLIEFLQSWTLQGKSRIIKFKGKVANQQIEFEGSLLDMEKLLATLEKKQKKKG